ncbi:MULTISPECIES: hypothetical protein [Bacillus]|nr:hypothetical protein [Bacillus toyonensis]QWU47967.1 hypothetical protein KPL75_02705 [Bacillus sp. NP247]
MGYTFLTISIIGFVVSK